MHGPLGGCHFDLNKAGRRLVDPHRRVHGPYSINAPIFFMITSTICLWVSSESSIS